MEAPDKDVLKGLVLERWMEDLRQDRAPTVLPELERLSREEIAETLELARWLSATVAPVSPTPTEAESVVAAVRERIRRDEEQQEQAIAAAVEQAASYGGLLRAARRIRGLEPSAIERAAKLAGGMLQKLEEETLPPHRVPVDAMERLLRSLRLVTEDVVVLIRRAGSQWAARVYGEPATHLGRVDSALGADDRHLLLGQAATQDEQRRQMVEELASLDQYCRSLESRLG